ncbi:pyridoxal-phosphate dependent enzyme [Homoserinimonas sp. OAct 916]|uniref:pyridoxal-phosphate dependent enzyme n=1 Tax=Homoserinimonas sp. OAct 916 TaxID=2211450 RepID=UPI0018E54B52|nr:pyridoxal-phosphate dependent enzyme [Homoserinimonas sp. OAct 916]
MLDFEMIEKAARQLHGVAHRTPVLTSRTLDELSGATVYLKAENFQRIGAFKFRGAYNVISRLDADELRHGVAAYSSGNHAQAVALAASMAGTQATILMPEDAPAAKIAATRGYGASVEFYDRYTGDRVALGNRLAAERGLTLVPPYEHAGIMAGQGTAALELIRETGSLDALLVPIGGGGLMAGSATAAKHLKPDIRMVGVEPTAGDDTKRSLAAGKRVRIPVPKTIADGQGAEIPGEMTFAVNQRLVDSVEVVSDQEIIDAMVFAFDRLKIVLEPSGASALAAVMNGRGFDAGARVGVILSGGNVGVERFRELTANIPGQNAGHEGENP